MLPQTPISRRQFITSVSVLALAAVAALKSAPRVGEPEDEFVLLNGWVLKRSELA